MDQSEIPMTNTTLNQNPMNSSTHEQM